MYDYLRVLLEITQSAEKLLGGEFHSVESPEIKQTAVDLTQAIQPCFQQIRESTNKLKPLVKKCLDELDHAEDVWNSKARISTTSTTEIYEKLAEILAAHIQVKLLGETNKNSAIQVVEEAWNKRFKSLEDRVFIDQTGKTKQGIGFNDKEIFIKALPGEISSHERELNETIIQSLKLTLNQVKDCHVDSMSFYIDFLNKRERSTRKSDFYKTKDALIVLSSNLNTDRFVVALSTTVNPTLEAWKRRWGDIIYNEALEIKNSILESQIERIEYIFEQRVKFFRKTLDEIICFYDYFLQLQNQYRQETREQYLAEKAWIDLQRQQLQLVDNSLDSILVQMNLELAEKRE